MRRFQIIIVGLISILSVSCVTTKITSHEDSGFNNKISRIFITFKGTESSNEFINSLAVDLKKEFDKHGVESTLHIDHILPLSMETEGETILRDLRMSSSFNAEVVMLIDQSEMRSYRGTQTGSTLNIRLYVPQSDKPVWKGLLTADKVSVFPNMAQASAVALVKKLQSDQIIN